MASNYARRKRMEKEAKQKDSSGSNGFDFEKYQQWKRERGLENEDKNIHGQSKEDYDAIIESGKNPSDKLQVWKGQSEDLLERYDQYSYSGNYQDQESHENYNEEFRDRLLEAISLRGKYKNDTKEIDDIVARMSTAIKDNTEGREYYSQWNNDEEYQKFRKYEEENEKRQKEFADFSALSSKEMAQEIKEQKKETGLYARLTDKEYKEKKRQYKEALKKKQQEEASMLPQRADFAEKSAYIPAGANYLGKEDFRDEDYEYINDSESGFRKSRGLDENDLSSRWAQRGLGYVSDQERKTYNYLYATEGKEKAREYIKNLEPILTERMTNAAKEDAGNYAKKHPILSSAESVVSNVVHSGEGFTDSLGRWIRGEGVDVNSHGNLAQNMNNEIRNAITEEIDSNAGKLAYQIGMSMADSAAAAGAAGMIGIPAAKPETAPFLGGIIEKVIANPEAAASLIMAGNAASQGVIEAKERGTLDGKAILTGTIQGATEYLLEKIPLDQLKMFAQTPPESIKGILKNVAKGAATEGIEEGATSVINMVADKFVNKDFSEFNQTMQQYMEYGLSEEEAKRKTIGDMAYSVAMDAFAGAVSGGIMSGGVSSLGYALNKSQTETQVPEERIPSEETQVVEQQNDPEEIPFEEAEIYSGENPEVAPAQQVSEKIKPEETKIQAAKDVVDTVLEYGSVPDDMAAEIAENNNMRAALEEKTGVKLSGNKEQQKNAVKEIVRVFGERKETMLTNDTQTPPTAQNAVVRGKSVEITGIDIKDDLKPKFKAVDGKIYEAKDVNFTKDSERKLYSDAARFAVVAGKEAANEYVRLYDPKMSLPAYAKSFDFFYKMGKNGVPLSTALKSADVFVSMTSKESMSKAWSMGMDYRKEENARVAVKKEQQKRKGTGTYKDETRLKNPTREIAMLLANKTGIDIVRKAELQNDANAAFIPSMMTMLVSERAENEYTAMIHELGEFGLAYDREGMKEVQETLVKWWAEKEGIRGMEELDDILDNYQRVYKKAEGSKTREQAMDEIVNDAIGGLLSTETGSEEFIDWLKTDSGYSTGEQKTIVQRIMDILDKVIQYLKDLIGKSDLSTAAKKAAQMEEQQAKKVRQKLFEAFDRAIEKANTSGEYESELEGIVKKFSLEIEKYLDPYEETQRKNWAMSKKIELYENEAQLRAFVEKAYRRENAGKKLYFGIIKDEIAKRVKKELGYDIKGYNCALYSDNIRKIFKDHGEIIKESKRGQRAIVVDDFMRIPEIISNADEIADGGTYNHSPVIHLKKDGITIVAVLGKGSLDLYPQTMYASKKNRSLATATDEQAPVYTPNTTRSTASKDSISEDYKITSEKHKFSLKDPKEWGEEGNVIRGSEEYQSVRDQIAEQLRKQDVAVEITDTSVKAVAARMAKKYKSFEDVTTLENDIGALFKNMASGGTENTGNHIYTAESIVRPMLEQSEKNLTINDYSKEILKDIKGKRIKLDKIQSEEVSYHYGTYNDFRKKLFGRAYLSKEGAPLDILWKEWASAYPEWFQEDLSPADQPVRLAEIIDSLKEDYVNEYGFTLDETVTYAAAELMQEYFNLPEVKAQFSGKVEFKDNLEGYMENLKQEYHQKYVEYTKYFSERYKQIPKEYRQRMARQQARQQAKFDKRTSEERAKRLERQNKKKYRDRIVKNTKDVLKILEDNTDKRHVPEVLKKLTINFLESMDFVSEDGWKNQTTVQLQNRLNLIFRKFSDDAGHNEGSEFMGDMDPDFLPKLSEMIEKLEESTEVKKIGEMDSDQLKDVDYLVYTLKRAISTANKLIANEQYEKISQIGDATMQHMSKLKAKRRRNKIAMTDKMLNIHMLAPNTFFKHMGEGAMSIYHELREGLNKRTWMLKNAQTYMEDALKDIKVKDWTGKKAKKHFFEYNGKKFELTEGQLMNLYILSKRPQALGHLTAKAGSESSGFVIDTKSIVRKQEIPERTIKVSEAQLNEMFQKLTPEQKRVADRMQRFLAKDCADWGNEVSMILYGYKKFGEKTYWPIKTSDNFNGTNDKNADNAGETANASLYGIRNLGMTKNLVKKANNPIVVGDIFDVFSEHVANMANYNAFVVPLTDAMKWFNYKSRTEEGTVTGSLKEEMERAFGTGAKGYFIELIKNINGETGKGVATEISSTFSGRYKAAAVGANIRTVIQQPTAFFRVSSVMNPKYMMKAAGKRPAVKEMMENSAIAMWKSWGYFETGIGQSMKQVITGESTVTERMVELSMAGAGKADDITWGIIWNAVKEEIRDKNKDLDLNSEEYKKLVRERFDEVIDETQVVDTVLHRSQIMRSNNGFAKFATAFMAEPTKSYNLLYDAWWNWKQNHTAETGIKVLRAATVYALTGIATAAAASMVDVFRDDDEEKEWSEKYMENFKENMADNLNPLNMIPYLKEIPSFVKGFDATRMDVEGIGNLVNSVMQIGKYFEGTSKKTAYGLTKNIIRSLSQVTGIPAYNLLRDTEAFIEQFTFAPFDEEQMTGKTVRIRLLKAMNEGNDEQLKKYLAWYEEQYQKKIEDGKTPDEARAALKSSITRQYKEIYQKAPPEEKVKIKSLLYKISAGNKQLYKDYDWSDWDQK